jgi:hypothetical protein
MTYDHWKTTEPEPFEEWPPDDDEPELYECDCCGKMVSELSRVFYCGIETFACDECREW